MFGSSAMAKTELKLQCHKHSWTGAKIQLRKEFLTIAQTKKVLSMGGSLKEKHMEARLD